MSDDKIDNPVSYSKLQELEDDFEDVEVELRMFTPYHYIYNYTLSRVPH